MTWLAFTSTSGTEARRACSDTPMLLSIDDWDGCYYLKYILLKSSAPIDSRGHAPQSVIPAVSHEFHATVKRHQDDHHPMI